jgi:hypothetical protein
MSLRVVYRSPADTPAPATDATDALYALADAGATAEIELDGYRLPLDGTGLAELHRQSERLLHVLATGEPALGDDALRAELPDVPADAVLHSWLFASYMRELPVVVFAIDGDATAVYTRTRAETDGWPLVVLEGRDLADPITVPTRQVAGTVQGFLDQIGHDVARLLGLTEGEEPLK